MKVICKLPELMKSVRGLDQKTLAAQTGLSPTTVGKLYRGHFDRIDNHTVTTLCKFFELRSIAELIEIEWEPEDSDGGQPGPPRRSRRAQLKMSEAIAQKKVKLLPKGTRVKNPAGWVGIVTGNRDGRILVTFDGGIKDDFPPHCLTVVQ